MAYDREASLDLRICEPSRVSDRGCRWKPVAERGDYCNERDWVFKPLQVTKSPLWGQGNYLADGC